MKFEFIDNGAIDRRTRRQIRSHAAKGHNAGRKLTRPSRKKPLTRVESARVQSPALPVQRQKNDWTLSVFSPGSSNLLSALPTFLQLVAKSTGLRLLQRTVVFFSEIRYAPVLEPVLDHAEDPRTKFVDPIFQDEAYFHGALAVFMSAFPRVTEDATTGEVDNTSARLRHFGLALRMVNARLSGQDAASNNNVKAVLLLGLYERYTGSYPSGLVHLDGLCRMLDMRGGLDGFSRSSQGLARKILRCDLECALHLGMPTRLPLRDIQRLIPHSKTLMAVPFPSLPAQQSVFSSRYTTNTTHQLLLPHTAAPSTLRQDIYRAPGTPSPGISPSLFSLVADATHTARILHLATAALPNTATAHPETNVGLPTRLASVAVHDTYLLLGYRLQALTSFLLNRARYQASPETAYPATTTATTDSTPDTRPDRNTGQQTATVTDKNTRNPFPPQTGLSLGLMGFGMGSGMGLPYDYGLGSSISSSSSSSSSSEPDCLTISAPPPPPGDEPGPERRDPLPHHHDNDNDTTTAEVERALCVGLTAFIASFLWGGSWCGLARVGDMAWVGRAAREVVDGGLLMLEDEGEGRGQGVGFFGAGRRWEREVLLWMVCVAEAAGLLPAPEENGIGDEGWVVHTVREVASMLGLREWEDVKLVLGRFPWVEALHGDKTRKLWERSVRNCI